MSSNSKPFIEVASADHSRFWQIPSEDVIHMPQQQVAAGAPAGGGAKALLGAEKVTLQLCPDFDASHPSATASCPAGNKCAHVHALMDRAHPQGTHVNLIFRDAADAPWERFEPGSLFQVAIPNASAATDEIPSHLVFKTRALQSTRRVLSHCAHYYFSRSCNRGELCYFVHGVSLAPLEAQPDGHAADAGPLRRVWGRMTHADANGAPLPPDAIVGLPSSCPPSECNDAHENACERGDEEAGQSPQPSVNPKDASPTASADKKKKTKTASPAAASSSLTLQVPAPASSGTGGFRTHAHNNHGGNGGAKGAASRVPPPAYDDALSTVALPAPRSAQEQQYPGGYSYDAHHHYQHSSLLPHGDDAADPQQMCYHRLPTAEGASAFDAEPPAPADCDLCPCGCCSGYYFQNGYPIPSVEQDDDQNELPDDGEHDGQQQQQDAGAAFLGQCKIHSRSHRRQVSGASASSSPSSGSSFSSYHQQQQTNFALSQQYIMLSHGHVPRQGPHNHHAHPAARSPPKSSLVAAFQGFDYTPGSSSDSPTNCAAPSTATMSSSSPPSSSSSYYYHHHHHHHHHYVFASAGTPTPAHSRSVSGGGAGGAVAASYNSLSDEEDAARNASASSSLSSGGHRARRTKGATAAARYRHEPYSLSSSIVQLVAK